MLFLRLFSVFGKSVFVSAIDHISVAIKRTCTIRCTTRARAR
jgi:hypothetical protein